jgi:hypothetical protein
MTTKQETKYRIHAPSMLIFYNHNETLNKFSYFFGRVTFFHYSKLNVVSVTSTSHVCASDILLLLIVGN